jgi:hypothetical protein
MIMLNLPEIKRKKPKPAYRKPEAVKQLERMADAEAHLQHPTCPHLAPRTFRDDSSNSLTQCVVKYITLKGGFASRLSSQGTFSRKLNKFIPGTQKRGIADIMGTFKSKSLMIEVKHGKDKMSVFQEKVRDEQQRSGGLWFTAKNFTEFKEWFDNI